MPRRIDPATTLIYHITDVENLPGILAEDGLLSDARMAERDPTVIGYDHIKKRRLEACKVSCRGNRFVGEFVPFYFCPRSPMLFTINQGNTGLERGCQKTILHLVSTVAQAVAASDEWAISDGNAAAAHAWFYANLDALKRLDWKAIEETDWQGMQHQKAAEFLVADFFPWSAIQMIGCYEESVAQQVGEILGPDADSPVVQVKREWYY